MSGADSGRLRRFLAEETEAQAEGARQDLLLGQIAVAQGALDRDRLAEALREQEEARRRGGWTPIGQILLGRGWIDAAGLDRLLQLQRNRSVGANISTRYELRDLVGEGATSTVCRAWDRDLKRFVAVKILREALGLQPAVRKRFEREARTAAAISHPNVVAVHDVGEADGCLYLVMELVEGRSLAELLATRASPPGADLPEVVRILRKVADGIAVAHARGIVHRDLKPANILIADVGEPKVSDFGLAQVAGEEAGLTRTGAVMGTPLYMAPEQVRGRNADIGPRTDVYALGAILYEALAGRPPHSGGSVTEIYDHIVQDDPEPPSRLRSGVPRDLETVALKALGKVPSDRYATVQEFSEDLRRWLEGEPIQARPPGLGRRARRWIARHRILVSGIAGVAVAALAWYGADRVTWRRRQDELLKLAAVREKSGMYGLARDMFRQALSQDPASAEAKQGYGRASQALMRQEEDEREAGRILDEASPAIERAVVYLYTRDADYEGVVRKVADGQRLIEQAIAKAPKLARGHYLLGRALEILGWDDKAEAAWRRVIALDPGSARAHYRLGRILLNRAFMMTYMGPDPASERQAVEAARAIETALAGKEGLEDALQLQVARALAAYCRRDPDEARRLAIEGAASFGGQEGAEELHWIHGLTLEGDPRKEAYDRALKIRPRYPLALFARGSGYLNAGRLAEAAADLSLAVQVSPRFAYAYCNRASAFARLGRIEEAIADLDEALKIDPGLTLARTNRGLMLFNKGDVDGAMRDTDEVIRTNPANAAARLNRGVFREKAGDFDGAREDYDEAVRLAPEDASAWMVRGLLRSQRGDRDGALSDYGQALKLNPHLAKARVNRGNILRDRGELDKALEDYDEAVRIDPTLWNGYLNRGPARHRKGDEQGAIDDMKRGLDLLPRDHPDRAAYQRVLDGILSGRTH